MSLHADLEIDALTTVRKACQSCVGIDKAIRRERSLSNALHMQIGRQLGRKDLGAAQKRIVTLNHEKGMLQYENIYFATLAIDVLGDLFSSVQHHVNILGSAIERIDAAFNLKTETLDKHPLTPNYAYSQKDMCATQERHNVQSHPPKRFIGPKPDFKTSHLSTKHNRPLPQPPNLNSLSKLDALENELTIDNSVTRLLIFFTRKLIFRVLPQSLPRVCQEGIILQSLGKPNTMLKQTNSMWQDEINEILREYEDLDQGSVSVHSSLRQFITGHRTTEDDDEEPVTPWQVSDEKEGNLDSPRMDQGVFSKERCLSLRRLELPKLSGSAESVEVSATSFENCQDSWRLCSTTNLKRRIRILRHEQLYYHELISEAYAQLIPTIKCHTDELLLVIRKYEIEEHEFRRTLQQELRLRGISGSDYRAQI